MIKVLVMDVDGTLIDGKLYIDFNGEIFKSFDAKDGYVSTNENYSYYYEKSI